jgi:dGTPase
VINDHKNQSSHFDRLVLKVLEKQINLNQETTYELLLAVCFCISKMSDSNAILTFKKLNAAEI